MADRTLQDMTYAEGVPATGHCSQCGREFSTLPDDAAADAEQATRDFYARFERHECRDIFG